MVEVRTTDKRSGVVEVFNRLNRVVWCLVLTITCDEFLNAWMHAGGNASEVVDVYVLINLKCTAYKVAHRQVRVDPREKTVSNKD